MASSMGYRREPESDSPGATAEGLKEKARRAKQKALDAAQNAFDKIDKRREPTANTLQSAASTLHQQSERVSKVAHRTADRLQSTADYVREHDARGMVKDLQVVVKEHPAGTLLAAVAFGFLFGRVFRRR